MKSFRDLPFSRYHLPPLLRKAIGKFSVLKDWRGSQKPNVKESRAAIISNGVRGISAT